MVDKIKAKIKPLSPSLKERKRYLVYEVISEKPFSSADDLSKTIVENTLKFLGELDTAKAGLIIVNQHFNTTTQRGILRINYRYVDKIRATLAMIDQIGKKEAVIKTITATGMLNKAIETTKMKETKSRESNSAKQTKRVR